MENLVKKISKSSLLLLFFTLLIFSCKKQDKVNTETAKETKHAKEEFKFWTWITADSSRTDSSYTEEFTKYHENGIDAVLINTYANPELLSRLAPLARKANLEVHAWMFTMNRPNDPVALQHPDWYMVSRSGKSCFNNRPYVDYYQWLSPSHPDARQHIWNLVENLAKVEDVASVHLDYIRYPDVYLPIGLLPKYNLVQNEELPDFDFDYSEVATEKFKKLHGKDINESGVPAIDMEWKQFRLNEIKTMVDGAYKIAHKQGKKLTAAVFPYPEMADHMVRQRWDKWDIDMVLPMIYYNFYNEEVDWVGFATEQGVNDLKAKNIELHTGLYVPTMSASDVETAIQLAHDHGAKGVSFFDGAAITQEQLKVIKAKSEAFKQ